MFPRVLDLNSVLARKSVFLFGPRQTGKSTWIKAHYPEALYINLLKKHVYDFFLGQPDALASEIELFHRKSNSNLVIIDEIQKLPSLLDEVQDRIEGDKRLRFVLTGSSARKLKRSSANLLGGRASWRSMFPLVYPEIKESLRTHGDLEKRLLIGGLPSIFTSRSPFEDLDDYLQLYLTEEIKAEGQVRNYESFHRFLNVAAQSNANQINFTQVGSDAQVPPRTIHDYYQILEDTLVGFVLPAFEGTTRRKAVTSVKSYLFDTGIVNSLLNRTSLALGTPEAGGLFEHFIINEVRAFCSYKNRKVELFYWRTHAKQEVDLVVKISDVLYAFEIKCKQHVSQRDYEGIFALAEEFPKLKRHIICLESRRRITPEKIEVWPVFSFLQALWAEEIF